MHQNGAKFVSTSTYLQQRTHFFWPYWKTNSQTLGGAKRNKPRLARVSLKGGTYLF